jgi:hypothetical protein
MTRSGFSFLNNAKAWGMFVVNQTFSPRLEKKSARIFADVIFD